MLTELVRKREKKKLERANHLKKFVEGLLFPKEDAMRHVLQAVKRYVRADGSTDSPPSLFFEHCRRELTN